MAAENGGGKVVRGIVSAVVVFLYTNRTLAHPAPSFHLICLCFPPHANNDIQKKSTGSDYIFKRLTKRRGREGKDEKKNMVHMHMWRN